MQPETIAGRYRVVRAVGKGGMGTVWLCTDETLHRQVAVKQVGFLPGESPGDTARAMREARLAAALNHKNAVSIYDVVEHAGSTWLVMEYVPSQTLSQLIAAEGRLSPDRVARVGAQVAAALNSAHALGIVHRDIKPGNILVGDDDAAKISDFGIARGHQDVHLTQTGMVTGTPAFFSPELARGEDPTFASDVWALGITLYTATEGRPPYDSQANPLAMLMTIARDPLPPPTHAGPLTGVLAGMLDPDPSQRSTMAEALEGLREVEQQTSPRTAPLAVATVADEPAAGREPPTTSIPAAVEPAYEQPVAVPALANSWYGDRADAGEEDAGPAPREGSRSGRLAMAALALLVLLGAGALLWNTLDLGGADDNEATVADTTSTTPGDKTKAPPSTSGDKTTKDDPTTPPETKTRTPDDPTTSSTPPTTSSTPPTTSSTPPTTSTPPTSSSPPTTTTAPVDPPASSPVEFAQTYFSIVPGDLDTGWSFIAPSMRQAMGGRGKYNGFWRGIASVDLLRVDADGQTVTYTATYTRTNGTTSTETKQLTLQPNGDSYLITSDTAA